MVNGEQQTREQQAREQQAREQQAREQQASKEQSRGRKGTGFLNIMKSTLAAVCGIQTKSNRERDFENARPSSFIIAGLVFVVVFILLMYGIVQLVMSLAAP